MLARIFLLVWILAGSPWAHAVKPDGGELPSWAEAAVSDRQIETLGLHAGVWGSLAGGFEGWVYPFKAFDGLTVLIAPAGQQRFVPLTPWARVQTAWPTHSEVEFAGPDAQARLRLFVPRTAAGGICWLEIQAQAGARVAVRFRPSLAPMHLAAGGPLSQAWDAGESCFRAVEPVRQAELAVVCPRADECVTGEQVELRWTVPPEQQVKLPIAFALVTGSAGSARGIAADLLRHEEDLLEQAASYYRGLLARSPLVESPDLLVNRALHWSTIALDQLRVCNPDLGCGLVSGYSSSGTGTRPRYCWFFEEPTLTSWAYHRVNQSSHVAEALRFLQRWQRADGKTLHEMTQSLRYQPRFLEEFQYAYMHSDGPVYFLAAYGEYLRATGDLEFLREQWPQIRRTFEWCRSRMDPADGLLRIEPGDWGSAESTTGMWKDTQLEAMWVRGLRDLARIASALQEPALAQECNQLADRARESIENKFWNDSVGNYVWGIDRGERRKESLVPHHAIGFWLGEFRADRVARSLQTLAGSAFRTDWGVRSLSMADASFDPASYQSGSVWPVWNAGVIVSEYRHLHGVEAYRNWRAMLAARTLVGLGTMPEVLSGHTFSALPECVPHQMFSELAVQNGFYEGMLGLGIDVPGGRLRLAPQLPADWGHLRVKRIPFGQGSLDLRVEQSAEETLIETQLQVPQGLRVEFEPVLPANARISRVQLNGKAVSYRVIARPAATVVRLAMEEARGRQTVRIAHEGGVAMLPVDPPLVRGQGSRNLRLIEAGWRGGAWRMDVEGLPGRKYALDFLTHRQAYAATNDKVTPIRGGFRVEYLAPMDRPTNEAGFVRWQPLVQFKPRIEPTNLLVYPEADGELRPVKTRRDWQRRRADIERRMEEVMGPFVAGGPRRPPVVRVEEEVDCGHYVRQRLTYESEPGSAVPAYLLIPKLRRGAAPAPGVLCLHQTHPRGNKVVVGLGQSPNDEYGVELVQRGFVCLAPAYPLLADYAPPLEELGYASGTRKAIWDNMRGLDLLESLPYVRRGKFGVIGHSLGGHNGVFTAVLDPRIAVVVSSCGLDSFRHYMGGNLAGWSSARYMPRLRDYPAGELPFDFHELIAALAPRPCLLSAPVGDSNFHWWSVAEIVKVARPIYELTGRAEDLVVEHPRCGHEFPKAMREKAYALFEQHLR